MLPAPQLLKKVRRKIMSVPNRRGEHLRKVHYGCYLLCSKAGLRVSEAVSFSLANKTLNGLYRIEKPKGKKERLVYIQKKVIKELRKQNWKPNQTNRWNFYHFLKKIKRELGVSAETELTPHTLRHAFATYQAESGIPLPILQKLLGHSSIRTTALYWRNIYHRDDDDNIGGGILAGKKWLESREQPKPPLITENFAPLNKITTDYLFPQVPKSPESVFTDQKPLIPNKKPTHEDNSLSTPKTLKKTPRILTNKVSPKTLEKFSLNPANKNSDQLKTSQPLALITSQEQKSTKKETILLAKIKLLESSLETSQSKLTEALQSKDELKEKLTEIQKENNNLKQLLYQEKQQTDNYQQQLKVIIKSFYQWQKINYYQQIEQSLRPPPNFRK